MSSRKETAQIIWESKAEVVFLWGGRRLGPLQTIPFEPFFVSAIVCRCVGLLWWALLVLFVGVGLFGAYRVQVKPTYRLSQRTNKASVQIKLAYKLSLRTHQSNAQVKLAYKLS